MTLQDPSMVFDKNTSDLKKEMDEIANPLSNMIGKQTQSKTLEGIRTLEQKAEEKGLDLNELTIESIRPLLTKNQGVRIEIKDANGKLQKINIPSLELNKAEISINEVMLERKKGLPIKELLEKIIEDRPETHSRLFKNHELQRLWNSS